MLSQNEDVKDDFIQPFKSQGPVEVSDYGFVINTKFMSKPGKQFLIRRYAFNAIQKAFKENGIEFATPKVEVAVGGDDDHKQPDRKSANEKLATSRRCRSVAGAAAGHAARAAKLVQTA